jgi:predicted amidophosphoribosyltransferase
MRELVKMDVAVMHEHRALRSPGDECYYLFEFYPGRRYGFDPANDLIKNLKKGWAGEEVAGLLRPALASLFEVATTTFVPMPPSRVRSSLLYDDRVARLLRLACPVSADIRELVVCREDREPVHFSAERASVEGLLGNFALGEAATVRQRIVVFDDVITSGNHFVACKRFLLEHFPGRQVVGVFVARRVLG